MTYAEVWQAIEKFAVEHGMCRTTMDNCICVDSTFNKLFNKSHCISGK